MKVEKISKSLRKTLKYLKQDRDELLLKPELQEYEKEDLRDYNQLIMSFTEVINYFSPPSEHI